MNYYCQEHPLKKAVVYCENEKEFYCKPCSKLHTACTLLGIRDYCEQKQRILQQEYCANIHIMQCLMQIKKSMCDFINAKLISINKILAQSRRSDIDDSLLQKYPIINDYNNCLINLKQSVQEFVDINSAIITNTSLQHKCIVHLIKGSEIYTYNTHTQEKKISTFKMEFSLTASSILCYGKAFVMGGSINDAPINDVYEANISKETVNKKASMLVKKFGISLCLNDKTIYCIGGWNGKNSIPACEQYNIKKNCWLAIPQLQTPRHNSAVFIFGKYLYSLCGSNLYEDKYLHCNYLNSMERLPYDSLKKWEYVNLVHPLSVRDAVYAIPMNEEVLIIGG